MTTEIPAQIVVRLSEPQRAALATVLHALTTPHRSPPNLSEAVRAAITATAGHIAAHGSLVGL